MPVFGRRASRRQFLTNIAGVSGAMALSPAILGRAAERLVPVSIEGIRPSTSAEASLNHLAWVWQFTQDGTKERIREVLAAHGLGVALKTHDAVSWMSQYDRSPDAVDGPRQVANLAQFFEDGGVPFHAWSVLHGREPKREAAMAAEVLAAGARSISLDVEPHNGFWRGTAEDAITFGRELRQLQPDAWVVTSIDPRPWEVDRIPLAEFAAFTSEIAPQVYWSDFDTRANLLKYAKAGYVPGAGGVTPRFVLDAAMDRLRPFGLPVRPIGDGTREDEAEWSEFVTLAYEHQASAVSVWRFGVASAGIWRLLQSMPPRPLAYVVAPGDSLGALAARWGTSVAAIAEANGIANPNLIAVGALLRVPRGAALPPVSPPPVSPPPSTSTPPATSGGVHVVAPGETLSEIAERWGVGARALAEANGIADPNLVRIGSRLRIPGGGGSSSPPPPPAAAAPPPSTYTVQRGDSLIGIARRHGTTVRALVELNGLSNPDHVRVGQRLRVR